MRESNKHSEMASEKSQIEEVIGRNGDGYSLVDTDIIIILGALAQRDSASLDPNVEVTMPVSLSDYTLFNKLKEIKATKEPSLVREIYMPYNTRQTHWQLIRISRSAGQVLCGLYETTGTLIQPTGDLYNTICAVITDVKFVDPGTCGWHQWAHPAQRNVNCGIVVALMAHQLRLKTEKTGPLQTDYYAGLNPESTDASLRDQVSTIVIKNCTADQIDRFCRQTNNPDQQHEFSRFTYDESDRNQQSIREACEKLTAEQMHNITAIILRHEDDPTREKLKNALSKYPYSEFLFTLNHENEKIWKPAALDIVQDYNNTEHRKKSSQAAEQASNSTEGNKKPKASSQSEGDPVNDRSKWEAVGITFIHQSPDGKSMIGATLTHIFFSESALLRYKEYIMDTTYGAIVTCFFMNNYGRNVICYDISGIPDDAKTMLCSQDVYQYLDRMSDDDKKRNELIKELISSSSDSLEAEGDEPSSKRSKKLVNEKATDTTTDLEATGGYATRAATKRRREELTDGPQKSSDLASSPSMDTGQTNPKNVGKNDKRGHADMQEKSNDKGVRLSKKLAQKIQEEKKLDEKAQQTIEAYHIAQDPSQVSIDTLIYALQIPNKDTDFRNKVISQLINHCLWCIKNIGSPHNRGAKTIQRLIQSNLLLYKEQCTLKEKVYEAVEIYCQPGDKKLSYNALVRRLIIKRELDLLRVLHAIGCYFTKPHEDGDTVWHSLIREQYDEGSDPLKDDKTLHEWFDLLPDVAHYLYRPGNHNQTVVDVWVQNKDDILFFKFGEHIIERYKKLKPSLNPDDILIGLLDRYPFETFKEVYTRYIKLEPLYKENEATPKKLRLQDERATRRIWKTRKIPLISQSNTTKTMGLIEGGVRVLVSKDTKEIDDAAFLNCLKLIVLETSEGFKLIGKHACRNCKNLKYVMLNNGIEYLGDGAFSGCTSLIEFRLPNGLKIMGCGAFEGCKALEYVDICEGIQSIESATFKDCISLESFRIPKTVTSLGVEAFLRCQNLKFVGFGNGLQFIGASAFKGCTSFSEIHLPNGLKKMGCSAFEGCIGLKYVDILEGLQSIESATFKNCIRLESFRIPNSVKSIGTASFLGCQSLEFVDFGDGLQSIGASALKDCKSLKVMRFPDGLKKIGPHVLEGCTSLESVVIPESVELIGRQTFYNCENLRSVVILGSATYLDLDMFIGCKSLETIVLPDEFCNAAKRKFLGIGQSVTCIPYSAYIKKRIDISKSIDARTFKGCTNLKLVKIRNTVTSLGTEAFMDCKGLVYVDIDEGIQYIKSSAFKGCIRLKSCKMPKTVTSLGTEAFMDCKGLESVDLGEGLLYIQCSTFKGCTSLMLLHIHDGLIEIGQGAFENCTSLQSVIIPESVKAIGKDTFLGCTSLETIVLPDEFCNSEKREFLGIGQSVTCIRYSDHIKGDRIVGEHSIFNPGSMGLGANLKFED